MNQDPLHEVYRNYNILHKIMQYFRLVFYPFKKMTKKHARKEFWNSFRLGVYSK